MTMRKILAAAALVGVTALSTVQPAQAQAYYATGRGVSNHAYWGANYAPRPVYYSGRYGPADPCARNAGNRALGWGLVGMVLGGLAGGAAAAAHVVAEGAALGGFVGGVTGAWAGHASARCGTAYGTGLPIVGVNEYGVAIYGPPQERQIYDYAAMEPAPQPEPEVVEEPQAAPPPVRRDYPENSYQRRYEYERHERYDDYDDYDDRYQDRYRPPRN